MTYRRGRPPTPGSARLLRSDSWDCWPIPGRAPHAELSSNLSASLRGCWSSRRCGSSRRFGLGGRSYLGFMCQMAGQSFQELDFSPDPLELLAIAVRRQKLRFLLLQSANIVFDRVNRVDVFRRLVIGNSLSFGYGLDQVLFVHASHALKIGHFFGRIPQLRHRHPLEFFQVHLEIPPFETDLLLTYFPRN